MGKKNTILDDIQIKSLTEVVYEKIKEAIVDKKFEPGSRISERYLVEELGVSATPIKSALHTLQVEGLVEIRPRSGTYVTKNFQNLNENIVIRAYLEGLAARFAAEKAVENDFKLLEEQLKVMEAFSNTSQHDEIVEANSEFHSIVHQIAHNPYIQQLIDVLRSFSLQMRHTILVNDDELQRGFHEHKSVYEAIREHDGELAEKRMRAHILRSLESKK
ncbi:MAG: GntR family transcriptional regulator [Sphaerochaetaceae bacterium]